MRVMKMATNYFAIRRMEIESLLKKEQEMNRYKADLNRMYRQMENEVQAEMDKYLIQYAEATGQTLEQARKNIDEIDLSDYQEHLRRYRIDKSPKAMRQLNIHEPSIHHTRLQLIQKRIAVITVSAADNEIRRLSNKLTRDYEDEYKRRLEQMGGLFDMTTSTAHIQRLAEAATKQRHYGRHFSTRVWKAQKEMQSELDNIISRAISLGENPVQNAPRLRKYVQDTVENKAYAARRLAHTETQNIQFEASNQMFKEYFDEKESTYDWLAEDDERTCSICGDLGRGGPYTLEELESIGTPHPNCRCSYTISSSYLKELRKSRGLERGDHD